MGLFQQYYHHSLGSPHRFVPAVPEGSEGMRLASWHTGCLPASLEESVMRRRALVRRHRVRCGGGYRVVRKPLAK